LIPCSSSAYATRPTSSNPIPFILSHFQERIAEAKPKAIILSGGPNSVHVEGAPRLPPGFFDYCREHAIPVLGICYGMQLLVHTLGGTVGTAEAGGEYGRMPIDIVKGSTLYAGESAETQLVWMSHGDEATCLPERFEVVARSQQGAIVGIEDKERSYFGLQYHPEVVHSERGAATIK
jgi:GMP synthase (glutamine-hydrolysing)